MPLQIRGQPTAGSRYVPSLRTLGLERQRKLCHPDLYANVSRGSG